MSYCMVSLWDCNCNEKHLPSQCIDSECTDLEAQRQQLLYQWRTSTQVVPQYNASFPTCVYTWSRLLSYTIGSQQWHQKQYSQVQWYLLQCRYHLHHPKKKKHNLAFGKKITVHPSAAPAQTHSIQTRIVKLLGLWILCLYLGNVDYVRHSSCHFWGIKVALGLLVGAVGVVSLWFQASLIMNILKCLGGKAPIKTSKNEYGIELLHYYCISLASCKNTLGSHLTTQLVQNHFLALPNTYFF